MFFVVNIGLLYKPVASSLLLSHVLFLLSSFMLLNDCKTLKPFNTIAVTLYAV